LIPSPRHRTTEAGGFHFLTTKIINITEPEARPSGFPFRDFRDFRGMHPFGTNCEFRGISG
jgi:hypothetical protein